MLFLIAGFIATLMVTYLLTFCIADDSLAGRVNWWVHMVIILTFLGLIPNSKHLHLLLSPFTVFFKSPELGTVPPLDFEKEQVGLETVKDLPKKARDAILFGTGEEEIAITYDDGVRSYKTKKPFEGVLHNLERLHAESESEFTRNRLKAYMTLHPCDACGGLRLKPEVLAVTLPDVAGAEAGGVPAGGRRRGRATPARGPRHSPDRWPAPAATGHAGTRRR